MMTIFTVALLVHLSGKTRLDTATEIAPETRDDTDIPFDVGHVGELLGVFRTTIVKLKRFLKNRSPPVTKIPVTPKECCQWIDSFSHEGKRGILVLSRFYWEKEQDFLVGIPSQKRF